MYTYTDIYEVAHTILLEPNTSYATCLNYMLQNKHNANERYGLMPRPPHGPSAIAQGRHGAPLTSYSSPYLSHGPSSARANQLFHIIDALGLRRYISRILCA